MISLFVSTKEKAPGPDNVEIERLCSVDLLLLISYQEACQHDELDKSPCFQAAKATARYLWTQLRPKSVQVLTRRLIMVRLQNRGIEIQQSAGFIEQIFSRRSYGDF